jgi:hypothetical protein
MIVRNWPVAAVPLDPVGTAATDGATDQCGFRRGFAAPKPLPGGRIAHGTSRLRFRWNASNPGQRASPMRLGPGGCLSSTGLARSTAFLHSALRSPQPCHHGHRQEQPGERRHDGAAGDPGALDIGRGRLEQTEARPRDVCSRGVRTRIGG